jgi:hypothetical protein
MVRARTLMKEVMWRKTSLKGCFSEEELRRVNRVRFALTRVLKEFNKANPKYVAYLEVKTWKFDSDCELGVLYEVYLYKRINGIDIESDDYVRIAFRYDVDKDLKEFLGFDNYTDIFDLGEALDLSFLFVRLLVTFYTA